MGTVLLKAIILVVAAVARVVAVRLVLVQHCGAAVTHMTQVLVTPHHMTHLTHCQVLPMDRLPSGMSWARCWEIWIVHLTLHQDQVSPLIRIRSTLLPYLNLHQRPHGPPA